MYEAYDYTPGTDDGEWRRCERCGEAGWHMPVNLRPLVLADVCEDCERDEEDE